jgi:putative alpha-1,2-mannosidase
MQMDLGPERIRDGLRVYVSALDCNRSFGFLIYSESGDKWAYSFDVVHDIPTLIEKRGGNASFVKSLDVHFNGGHNDHTNEV